ncbi:YbjN domain-containing protein [Aurantiacibacter sp. MUD11]|uniref:YbjN domain-containing protein n=1 Tax=Aurantiacibacter sp. MUD11 TaxID=3003265 RepID=UPI0022AADF28|nr:YbjN domain-containing protein [Aurantiacibacter sp. MUD11]WAT19037.1 YbjN domain-containing protein [Aurantiacibacter sp. MUD11]
MNTGRDTIEATEDAAPVEMLTAMFEAHGWACEQVGDDEVTGEVPGSWTTYQVRGIWRSEDKVLQLLCLPEIRVPDAKKRVAYELLALVNEQLWLGHFDIWSQGGVMLYRHGLMLGDDGLLSLDMASMAIESAISECDRFYPAFQFVLWGDKSPREALDAALVDAAGEA